MPVSVAIHGGAGNIARYAGTGRLEEAERFLRSLISRLHKQLLDGSAAIDVVQNAVMEMEDSGLFHAGKGTSPTSGGYPELDASVMEGSTRNAGAIAAVRTIKNPILLARYVLEHTDQVLMVGAEADALATAAGVQTVEPSYFVSCSDVGAALPSSGTVGAIAMDVTGSMASATSTGGTLNKRAGRVGDTPIIGAGTYAANGVGAISCTGVGEYFLRTCAAARVASRMELLGESAGAAAGYILSEIDALGGTGGMIVMDARGTIAMPFNTQGMYRARANSAGELFVACL